jgi:hypothetical protein
MLVLSSVSSAILGYVCLFVALLLDMFAGVVGFILVCDMGWH